MVNYYTLEDTPLPDIHAAFCRAFADYQVQFEMPLWRYESMLRRRGYAPHLSMGAFHRDELVGFLLNGVRDWQGRRTAYDTGTGVVPEHRRKGVTKRMFKELMLPLRDDKVTLYLLEVLKENLPAVKLYTKQGFKAIRGLTCYAAPKRYLSPGIGCDVEIKELPVRGLDWQVASKFWDFVPSWQNSTDSVLAASAELAAVGAYMNEEELVGYGIIEPRTGDLPQLAVRWDYRDQGVGRAILDELVALTEGERVSVVNVEEGAKGPRGFVEHLGFEVFTEQFEMVLDL
jgi:ribosomal protein S18 acetylase RimI-like enzyme